MAMSLQCIVAEQWVPGNKCQVWMETWPWASLCGLTTIGDNSEWASRRHERRSIRLYYKLTASTSRLVAER